MDSELSKVAGLAVWGSLAATLILGAFFLVQTAVDRPRRAPFAVFGLVMAYLGVLDLIQSASGFAPLTYEWLRLWWGGAYAGCALWLLGSSRRTAFGVAATLLIAGFSIFQWGNPALATTLIFPFAFGATSVGFGRRYLASRGYASAILCGYSMALALACSLYFAVVARGILAAILLGYLHFAIASITSVLLGWIHLARELQGRSPVRIQPPQAWAFFLVVVASELAIMLALSRYQESVSPVYVIGSLIQFGATMALFLRHRHQLVIHADNVGQLLEERTAELSHAREELARQNEILAQRLAEQERDLIAKGEVIDRQRRLELAAQTAGQVAHDMQNLLSPVLGKVEEIEEAANLNDVRVITASIRRQTQQLLEVNTHLLALSRRGRAESQAIRLSELARDVAERFPGQRITLDAKNDVWVSGSWAQLVRALSNLVTNALESDLDRLVPVTLRTGLVDVAQSRRCHLGFLGAGHYAFVEVEDSGPGIPGEHLDKIFEPFFSSKSGKKHRSGSGLGLTIVAAVVDDHKGVIDLVTGPTGTRFALYFPAHVPAVDASDLARLSCNATVLVVDDDTSIPGQVGPLLKEAGWTVISVPSGSEAIRVLQAQDVDVILLDFSMPRMNGLETFLAAMHLRPGVRAVVHSSYVTEEQALKLQALGVSKILLKPAGRVELLKSLREAYEDKLRAQQRRKTLGP